MRERVKLSRTGLGAAIIIACFTGGGLANAGENQDAPTDEARILASAKVTMSQVIAAAEQATGGKAPGIGIEDQDGAVNFEVTILKDNMRQKVLVDTQSGNVVKIVAAQNDEEDSDRVD